MFRERVFRFCYSSNMTTIQSLFPDLPAAKQEWLYYFIAEGCNGVLHRWMHNGMREPTEEVVSFLRGLIETVNAANIKG